MLAVADAQFQQDLMEQAKRAGKLPARHRVADGGNTPDRIAAALAPLRAEGLLPEYPFGTDFTADERHLMPALERLRQAGSAGLARYAVRGALAGRRAEHVPLLERMALARPSSLRERLYAAALKGALDTGT
jgi:hypothetical protein